MSQHFAYKALALSVYLYSVHIPLSPFHPLLMENTNLNFCSYFREEALPGLRVREVTEKLRNCFGQGEITGKSGNLPLSGKMPPFCAFPYVSPKIWYDVSCSYNMRPEVHSSPISYKIIFELHKLPINDGFRFFEMCTKYYIYIYIYIYCSKKLKHHFFRPSVKLRKNIVQA